MLGEYERRIPPSYLLSSSKIARKSMGQPSEQDELQKIIQIVERCVRGAHDWYQIHKRPNRILFRITGVGLIALSSLIPLLSAYEGAKWRIAVGIIGVLVAALTGVNTFFRWDRSWHFYSSAQFELAHLLTLWELDVAQAMTELDPKERLRLVREAARLLVKRAYRAQTSETAAFFKTVVQIKA